VTDEPRDDALATGVRLQGGSRTITDAEIAFLPALMGATNPLFHDEVRARNSRMGGRILYGPALLGIAVALTEHFLSARVVGLLEIRRVRFDRPVMVGDTVTASLEVKDNRPRESKPGRVLLIDDEVRNQHDETVLTFERLVLVTPPPDEQSPP
jgi:acyl dehydratase